MQCNNRKSNFQCKLREKEYSPKNPQLFKSSKFSIMFRMLKVYSNNQNNPYTHTNVLLNKIE